MSLIKNLEEKIDSLLKAYEECAKELESARSELESMRQQSQQKDLQISALYEEIGNRDRAVESLYDKVSGALASANGANKEPLES
ncbi:hypothetical protein BKN38_03015 [Helicobacter sp. CLO-3]|uniref:hypothetical protein n=1 Tax=unclassified Helicobacter TaxID=2593540 RepID=UPI0008047AE7|nr:MULTISPECIES: hypothetical protein [unclassified Helicobacter]OBV30085.1 hypothetical protein BA723_02625 [Helicobacter sp. CLO-3]OHU84438.1 hypothetical protein BKN38_03015 [Helicobacter sp. CLO-3]